MARPIWRGVLSFGMVAIPVRLSLATESSAKVSFNMLCAEHKARVNQKLWCAQGEHELKRSDTVKGGDHRDRPHGCPPSLGRARQGRRGASGEGSGGQQEGQRRQREAQGLLTPTARA